MEKRSNYQSYTEELESYNEAVRYATAEEQRKAYNEAYYRVNGRPELFQKIKDRTERMSTEIEAALRDKNLTEHIYTDFLFRFDHDICELSTYGELTTERETWIKEVKVKLMSYYLMYLKNQEEDFIKRNLSKYVDNIYLCAIERMEKIWPELAEMIKAKPELKAA